MVEQSDQPEFPSSAPLFQGLSPEMIERLRVDGQAKPLVEDQILFEEGDGGEGLYLIVHGTMRVFKRGRLIARRGAGDCLGEMAIIDAGPRTATARAETDCLLLHWPGDTILLAMQESPQLLQNMSHIMANRLHQELYERLKSLR